MNELEINYNLFENIKHIDEKEKNTGKLGNYSTFLDIKNGDIFRQ